jgi:hypothetical protein
MIRDFETNAEVPTRPKSAQLELVAHHYFLLRYAVYKVENEVQ